MDRQFIISTVNYLASVLYGCAAFFLFAFDKAEWGAAAGLAFISCYIWQHPKLRAYSEKLTFGAIIYSVALALIQIL